MAEFAPAVAVVLANEGGYSNDPNDPGGETNFGISKRQFPEVDIKNLTPISATMLYRKYFWEPYNLGALTSQSVANKVFDLVVNIGTVPAVRLLQQSLAYFLAGPIVADGKLGPQTASFAAEVPDEKLLPELRARACKWRCDEAIADPVQREYELGDFRRDVQ